MYRLEYDVNKVTTETVQNAPSISSLSDDNVKNSAWYAYTGTLIWILGLLVINIIFFIISLSIPTLKNNLNILLLQLVLKLVISCIGLIIILIGISKFSSIYKNKSIKNYFLFGCILFIITQIFITYISFNTIVLAVQSSLTFALTGQSSGLISTIINLIIQIVFSVLLLIIAYVFFYISYSKIATSLGISKFKDAGTLMLIGAILSIIPILGIINFIGIVYAGYLWYSIKYKNLSFLRADGIAAIKNTEKIDNNNGKNTRHHSMILIIILIISVLAIFFILSLFFELGVSGGATLPTACIAESGFLCMVPQFVGSNLSITIGQSTGQTFYNVSVFFLNGTESAQFLTPGFQAFLNTTPSHSQYINVLYSGSTDTVVIPLLQNGQPLPIGSKISGELFIEYKSLPNSNYSIQQLAYITGISRNGSFQYNFPTSTFPTSTFTTTYYITTNTTTTTYPNYGNRQGLYTDNITKVEAEDIFNVSNPEFYSGYYQYGLNNTYLQGVYTDIYYNSTNMNRYVNSTEYIIGSTYSKLLYVDFYNKYISNLIGEQGINSKNGVENGANYTILTYNTPGNDIAYYMIAWKNNIFLTFKYVGNMALNETKIIDFVTGAIS